MNLKDEVKNMVDDNFDNFNFNSPDLPISRSEFINILTDEFQRIINELMMEQMMASFNDPMNRHLFN